MLKELIPSVPKHSIDHFKALQHTLHNLVALCCYIKEGPIMPEPK